MVTYAKHLHLPFFVYEAQVWPLKVCCILTKDDSSLDHLGECQDFNLEAVAWAIQNGFDISNDGRPPGPNKHCVRM